MTSGLAISSSASRSRRCRAASGSGSSWPPGWPRRAESTSSTSRPAGSTSPTSSTCSACSTGSSDHVVHQDRHRRARVAEALDLSAGDAVGRLAGARADGDRRRVVDDVGVVGGDVVRADGRPEDHPPARRDVDDVPDPFRIERTIGVREDVVGCRDDRVDLTCLALFTPGERGHTNRGDDSACQPRQIPLPHPSHPPPMTP